jgi:Na+-translocating ferredoxin:NAD+ oxidoreductase RnfD subunit
MTVETLTTGAESISTATELSTLKASMPMSGAVSEAARMGAVAPSIIGTIANTAFLLGGLFFVYKGMQMVVTGKNSFKKTV